MDLAANAGWLAALAVLILAGVAARFLLAQTAPGAEDGGPSREDLDQTVQEALNALRELELQKDAMDPDAYAAERGTAEKRAADALALRESSTAAPAAPKTARASWIGALWGGAVVGVIAVIVSGLPSAEPPPHGHSHPGTPATQAPDPEVKALLATLKATPDDTAALARLGHKLLRGMQLKEAKAINDRLLAVDAEHVEGQIHAAVLTSAMGDTAAGTAQLEALLKAHPDAAEAWFFRGMFAMQSGDQAKMKTSFQAFVTHAPEGPLKARIQGMLTRMSGAPAAP